MPAGIRSANQKISVTGVASAASKADSDDKRNTSATINHVARQARPTRDSVPAYRQRSSYALAALGSAEISGIDAPETPPPPPPQSADGFRRKVLRQ